MARAMRISNEAVRQRIHYARFLLRRKLQPLWPKDSLHARIIRHGKRAWTLLAIEDVEAPCLLPWKVHASKYKDLSLQDSCTYM